MLEIKQEFDQIADNYDNWYSQPLGKYVLEAELNALNLLLPKSGLGADVGAGTGIFAKALTKKNRSIICIDVSTGMLTKATERDVQAVAGTAEMPPIRHQSLDFIYLVATIEFMQSPTTALSSLRCLLKQKCPIIVLAINRISSWGKNYIDASEKGDTIFKHAHFYTLEEVTAFFEKSDYEITQVIWTLVSPPTTIPDEKPSIISSKEELTAGVFLLKGQKKQ